MTKTFVFGCEEMTAQVNFTNNGISLCVEGFISTARGIEKTQIEGHQRNMLINDFLADLNPAESYYNMCR